MADPRDRRRRYAPRTASSEDPDRTGSTARWTDPSPRDYGGSRGSMAEGFRESLPFFGFGVGLMAVALWLHFANLVPTSPFLWWLLLGVGGIGLLGGFVGAIAAPADAPSPPEDPPRPELPAWEPEIREEAPALREPRPRVRPQAPLPRVREAPIASDPLPWADRSPSAAPASRASETPLPGPAIAPGPAPPAGRPVWDEGPRPGSEDEVLRSIDELSNLLRSERHGAGPRAPTERPSGRPTGRSCVGCEIHLLPDEIAVECAGCGMPMCATCREEAGQDGRPDRCPTCSVLSEGEGAGSEVAARGSTL